MCGEGEVTARGEKTSVELGNGILLGPKGWAKGAARNFSMLLMQTGAPQATCTRDLVVTVLEASSKRISITSSASHRRNFLASKRAHVTPWQRGRRERLVI